MYDPMTIRYKVVVPNNQFLAIGYGPSMTGTDMVIWEANGLQSINLDLYSVTHGKPSTDSQQDYNTSFVFNGTHVTFTSNRAVFTGDPNDFIIP